MISLKVQISLTPVKMTIVNGLLFGNLTPVTSRLERSDHVVWIVPLATGKRMALLPLLICYI